MNEVNKGPIWDARFSPGDRERSEQSHFLRQMKNLPKPGDFYFQMDKPGLPERGQMKIKRPYERSE
jgi:hypothetical protein